MTELKEPLLGNSNSCKTVVIDVDAGEGTPDSPDGGGSSSFLQAVFNNVGVLVGLGMLSCPYSLERGGWLGLTILVGCAILFYYSAYILSVCLRSNPGASTYQQIAGIAFGWHGRLLVTIILYLELLGTLVGFTITLSDNLVKIFPHAGLDLVWLKVGPAQLLPLVAVMIILPIIWMRDLSWVSYVSLGGIAAYLVIVLAVLWAGVVDNVGFHYPVTILKPGKLAEVTGLFAFCYSGHLVIPRIYSSMKNPSQFPKVAMLSFFIATSIYLIMAVSGAMMFGEKIQSQVTLNLPTHLLVAKVALWVVILIPLTKYALIVNPAAVELENLLSSSISQSPLARLLSSIAIRTLIMVLVLAIALSVPGFETTIAFIGSAISVTTCVILPCFFYMSIFREGISKQRIILNSSCAAIGVLLAAIGTVGSVRKFLPKTLSC